MGFLEKFKGLPANKRKAMAIEFAVSALEHIDICHDVECELYWYVVSFFGKELKNVSEDAT